MLKAAVVYIPGSGGNFLYRVLNLSERFINPGDTDPNNIQRMSSLERLAMMNNWISTDTETWKDNEDLFQPGYRTSSTPYVDYEQTPNWFLDNWHPNELVSNLDTLFGENFYQHLVVIDALDHKDFLLRNQRTKKYGLDWPVQTQALEQCLTQFSDRVVMIPFSSFFEWALFAQEIERIGDQLDLALPMDLVYELWAKWYTESQKLWQ